MRRLLLAGALAATVACAHGGQPDIATLASNSDQVIWQAGQKAYQKKQWDSARQHFKRIVDGFGTSKLQPDARLALGDTYFEEGGVANYILAAAAYRDFLSLYPSHPKSAYAQYRVAQSYDKQRNSSDRDQTSTQHALEEYTRLLEVFPDSSYAEEARARVGDCRHSLAEAEFNVGFFYQRTRQACRAAIPRYQSVLTNYPEFPRYDEVLFRLGQCLNSAGRAAEALPQLSRLISDFPSSSFVPAAQRLMDEITKAGVTPATPPSPEAPEAGPAPEASPAP